MQLYQMIPLFGTIVNALAVVAGSSVGLLLRSRIKEDVMHLPMQCMGAFTLVLGLGMALKSENQLILVASICLGSIAGGLLDIDGWVERGIAKIQSRFKSLGGNFSQGLITAFLIFCMGSMSVLGAFEDGLGNYPALLLTKSMMDGLSSIALSASLGVGVIFSAILIILYQGALTLAVTFIQPFLTPAATVEMTAAGGIMLIGIGLSILDLIKIKTMNVLPCLVVAVVLARIFM